MKKSLFSEGSRPTLEEVLDRRERRAYELTRLAAEGETVVVCFKLNIPGPVKSNETIERVFDDGVTRIRESLAEQGIVPAWERELRLATGPEYEASFRPENAGEETRAFAGRLKRLLVMTEENTPLGRLYDIDVETASGAVSREELGISGRRCFLCDRPAKECARSRVHSVSEMLEWIEGRILESGALSESGRGPGAK